MVSCHLVARLACQLPPIASNPPFDHYCTNPFTFVVLSNNPVLPWCANQSQIILFRPTCSHSFFFTKRTHSFNLTTNSARNQTFQPTYCSYLSWFKLYPYPTCCIYLNIPTLDEIFHFFVVLHFSQFQN